jgi:hypothetical protein
LTLPAIARPSSISPVQSDHFPPFLSNISERGLFYAAFALQYAKIADCHRKEKDYYFFISNNIRQQQKEIKYKKN